jgi:hypothetical protein
MVTASVTYSRSRGIQVGSNGGATLISKVTRHLHLIAPSGQSIQVPIFARRVGAVLCMIKALGSETWVSFRS